MAKATKENERRIIARKRIVRILETHTIAGMRTLEQKISDAGPYNQRIDPHVLTSVKNDLKREGVITERYYHDAPWFFLTRMFANGDELKERLDAQLPVFKAFTEPDRKIRIGQALEIAIYRALLTQDQLTVFGGFPDLNEHEDDRSYKKVEPPSLVNGREISKNRKLDFLVHGKSGHYAGIEAKNTREWVYPDKKIVREMLSKCLELDCVPVLIVRRYQYSLFSILSRCGVILHQNYSQLIPAADSSIAEQAKNKKLLAYHDLKIGNLPDKRLVTFLGKNLPKLLPDAYSVFSKRRPLLDEFANKRMKKDDFLAQLKASD